MDPLYETLSVLFILATIYGVLRISLNQLCLFTTEKFKISKYNSHIPLGVSISIFGIWVLLII